MNVFIFIQHENPSQKAISIMNEVCFRLEKRKHLFASIVMNYFRYNIMYAYFHKYFMLL